MFKRLLLVLGFAGLVGACSTPPSLDYSRYYAAQPRSIVVVPVINHTNDAEASNLFLSTLAIPLAERGYYVFPTNMVKDMMEQEGLSDPYLVHSTPTPQLAGLFGADAVLYVEILNWKSTYAVLATGIKVEFVYTLKDGRNGNVLWQHQREYFHNQSSSSGNIFVDLIATAIVAAVESSRSDYTPVAVAANAMAVGPAGTGLPFGPYNPNRSSNASTFKATGDGRFSDARWQPVSSGGAGMPPPKAKPAYAGDDDEDSFGTNQTPTPEPEKSAAPQQAEPEAQAPAPVAQQPDEPVTQQPDEPVAQAQPEPEPAPADGEIKTLEDLERALAAQDDEDE